MKVLFTLIYISLLSSCLSLTEKLSPPQWIYGEWIGVTEDVVTKESLRIKVIFEEKNIFIVINGDKNEMNPFFRVDSYVGKEYVIETWGAQDKEPSYTTFKLVSEGKIYYSSRDMFLFRTE